MNDLPLNTATGEPTKIVVEYYIPIFVVVSDDGDGEGPYISKVVVYDEHELTNGKAYDSDGNALDASDEAGKAAIAFVENPENEWPGWQFGW